MSNVQSDANVKPKTLTAIVPATDWSPRVDGRVNETVDVAPTVLAVVVHVPLYPDGVTPAIVI